jgi:hypothetical protein
MAGLLDSFPLQIKTLLETATGTTSPITEKNLSGSQKQKITDSILAARAYREALLQGVQNNAPLSERDMMQYKKLFPNQAAIDRFKAGSGTVNYDDIYNGTGAASDWNMLPSGEIRNTLGQFNYTTDKQGNINVRDRYDFLNDMIEGLPKEVSNSARYKSMSNPEKVMTLAKETFYMPKVGFSPILGLRSVPSRVGNAFVGGDGRDVNITFKPTSSINPSQDVTRKTLMNLLGVPTN